MLIVLLIKYFHVAEVSVLICIIVCKNIYEPEKQKRSWNMLDSCAVGMVVIVSLGNKITICKKLIEYESN